MDLSLAVAKVLGMYLIISGFFLIVRGKTVPRLLQDFYEHPAIMYLTGIILVFLSSMVLIEHNIWDGTWRTIITVLVWAVFLKGIAYIFIPEALHRMVTKKVLQAINLYGIVALIAGLSLFYVG